MKWMKNRGKRINIYSRKLMRYKQILEKKCATQNFLSTNKKELAVSTWALHKSVLSTMKSVSRKHTFAERGFSNKLQYLFPLFKHVIIYFCTLQFEKFYPTNQLSLTIFHIKLYMIDYFGFCRVVGCMQFLFISRNMHQFPSLNFRDDKILLFCVQGGTKGLICAISLKFCLNSGGYLKTLQFNSIFTFFFVKPYNSRSL